MKRLSVDRYIPFYSDTSRPLRRSKAQNGLAIALVSAFIMGTADASGRASDSDGETNHIPMVTTNDLGRPQEIIDGACGFGEFPRMTLGTDNMLVALRDAFESLAQQVRAADGDALVAFDVDFENRVPPGEEGRVLVCGTIVRFLTDE